MGCECGKEYTLGNQSRHLKTIFHQKYLSLNKCQKYYQKNKSGGAL